MGVKKMSDSLLQTDVEIWDHIIHKLLLVADTQNLIRDWGKNHMSYPKSDHCHYIDLHYTNDKLVVAFSCDPTQQRLSKVFPEVGEDYLKMAFMSEVCIRAIPLRIYVLNGELYLHLKLINRRHKHSKSNTSLTVDFKFNIED